MKVVPNKILVIIVGLLASNLIFAAPEPPQPAPPIPPPGLPIDGNLFVLVVVLLVYAFYKLLNYKKASI